jgi:UDP-GlcNAc:undecaprenyl-phosphate/decaprenyl-phosphate GlcNAc-1-phosphate transferase
MIILFLTFGVSLAASLVLTPLARGLATRCGLLDRPDGQRKLHHKPIPVAGGMAVFLSITVAMACLSWLRSFPEAVGAGINLGGLFLAGAVICALGVADDFGFLRGRHKLLGQFLAVIIVLAHGFMVRRLTLFHWELELGLLAVPFTVFWLVGAINALNLLDGMDGLLSSAAGIITLAVAVLAASSGQGLTACVALALVGALVGFLCYNFPPASIFLGDSGSMLIGLLVGVLTLSGSPTGPTTVGLLVPLTLLTIPIMDTVAAIVRRKATGRSVYLPDRNHLHHRLLHRGFSIRQTLLCISFFCFLTALGAVGSVVFRSDWLALATFLVVIATLVTTRLFGFAECWMIMDWLRRFFLSCFPMLRVGNDRLNEVRLEGSADWNRLLNTLTARSVDLNLKTVQLAVNAPALREGYHAQWNRFDQELEEVLVWRAEIPLAFRNHKVGVMVVAGFEDAEPMWKKLAVLMQLVEAFQAEDESARAGIATPKGGVGGRPPPNPPLEDVRSEQPASLKELILHQSPLDRNIPNESIALSQTTH